ncbi:FtsK/SpoIIIE domain-containing protein [Planococcus sp. APC 4015]|nr:FtsK/SpoIIIE domain-containing protein [Planococcus sp. APC 4015]
MPLPSASVDARFDDLLDIDQLSLPDAWAPPPRPPLPLVASTVPVLGAVALWLVTGSVFALLLAALGPLIAAASVVDGQRGARRDRKKAGADAAAARERVTQAVERRHARERRMLSAQHPDAAAFVRKDGDIWRRAPERADALVVGRGVVASEVRVTGGAGDDLSSAVRARATRLSAAPVVVSASAGVAVVGAGALAAAVHRALVLQMCLAVPPDDLQIVGGLAPGLEWVEKLPHRAAGGGRRLSVTAEPSGADVVIALVDPEAPIPPGCAAILTTSSLGGATLDHRGVLRELAVEAVGAEQAQWIADELAERAASTLGIMPPSQAPVAFADLLAAAPPARYGALPAVLGLGAGSASVVDLVADGPHAVVAGVTGSGKSELLITWVLALAATHSTAQVSFLLADFKGGTAFDGLRALPHVTGVITDLDGSGARRAIESLRAEVRWREGELARLGARDILDPRVELPRLVVVVDEFAALLGDHPELHAVFGDIAARGRALGMHLVLGTQRISGVVRDSLLANCPLRVSLRVTDAADSRAVIGTDEAARLPGAVRGIALVKRGADTAPHRVRIALSTPGDVAAIEVSAVGPVPRRPWLPDLPRRLELGELGELGGGDGGVLLLGLADEPLVQRQRPVGLAPGDRGLLVVGGPGAGKSTALGTVAAQAHSIVRVPPGGEAAWDAVADLVEHPPARGTVIVVDDLDSLASRLSPDHAHVLVERLEQVFRGAGDAGLLVVASAQRLTGVAARLGELLPRRLVLATSSRADHLAAGGDPAQYAVDVPPGRGHLDRIAVQVALADAVAAPVPAAAAEWMPRAALTGLVTRRRAAVRPALERWAGRGIRCLSVAEYAADPAATGTGPVVIVGDPDEWQREWRLLAAVRADHDLVVDTSCAAEYRVLTASRDLPPYAEHGARRAWLHSAGGDAVRIVLPGGDVRSDRRHARP